MEGLTYTLGEILRGKGLTIATAESCTAGGIGAAIASVDGASDYFVGGAIVYATRLKTELLGVPRATIAEHGVVSEQTAIAMSEGVRLATGADVAISVTGYIGASGGDAHAENGTVWISVGMKGRSPETRHLLLHSSRKENASQVIAEALSLAKEYLLKP